MVTAAASPAATPEMMKAPMEDPDIECVFFSSEAIAARVKELGAELVADYGDKAPLMLPVMTGGFMFAADLLRAMRPSPPGMWVESIKANSYFGTESSGDVKISPLNIDMEGRHVLLVEDIVDTGLTLEALRGRVLAEGAASCKIVTLLNKGARRRNGMVPDYMGFECQDQFVVGYGLDFNSQYRELPYIGVLKPEKYM